MLVARVPQRPLRAGPLVAAHRCSVPSSEAGAGSTFLGMTRWCLGERGRWRGASASSVPVTQAGAPAVSRLGRRLREEWVSELLPISSAGPASRWVPLARSQCMLAAVSFVDGGKCTEHSIYHLTICKCASLRRRTHSPHCLTIASVRAQTFASSPSAGPCAHGAVPPPPGPALLPV